MWGFFSGKLGMKLHIFWPLPLSEERAADTDYSAEEENSSWLCHVSIHNVYMTVYIQSTCTHNLYLPNILSLCYYSARVIAVRQVQGPGGIAQQTAYSIEQPGCPPRQLTRTIIVRPASRRPNDPNLPPSYDQAITGADRSVKVNEPAQKMGKNPLAEPLPQVPNYSAAGRGSATAPPNSGLPHMPPRQGDHTLPPAYEPTPSAPSPTEFYNDQQRLLN